MAFLSNLKPDSATQVGLLTAAGVYLIYSNAMPNMTDIRTTEPHNDDVESERRQAAWKSAALIGLVFLVSRDLNSYIISGAALFGIDYMYKHSNAVHPATGKVDTGGSGESIDGSTYAMPNYAESAAS